MKRFSWVIALLIFTAAAVSPSFSQPMRTSLFDADQTNGSRFALIAGETPPIPGKLHL